MSAVGSLIAVPLLGYAAYHLHMRLVVLPGLVNTKSELPRLTKDNAFSPHQDSDLYWGSYAANLYFGLKDLVTELSEIWYCLV